MTRSSPPDPAARGRTISGVTVVIGLVLVVLAGAGFAVAMYLALGPFSLRRHAAAQLAAESTRQTASPAATDEPLAATRTGDPPATTDDALIRAAQMPEGTDVFSPPLPAEQGLASPEVPLTRLSPLEIVGIGGNAGDWRGSLKIDGQIFENTVLLQPAENEEVTQIAFALKNSYTHLAGFVAIIAEDSPNSADAKRDQSQAVFRLYGDGNLLWDSGVLKELGARREFECEVRGVEVLTLAAESPAVVKFTRLAWGNLRLRPAAQAVSETEQR